MSAVCCCEQHRVLAPPVHEAGLFEEPPDRVPSSDAFGPPGVCDAEGEVLSSCGTTTRYRRGNNKKSECFGEEKEQHPGSPSEEGARGKRWGWRCRRRGTRVRHHPSQLGTGVTLEVGQPGMVRGREGPLPQSQLSGRFSGWVVSSAEGRSRDGEGRQSRHRNCDGSIGRARGVEDRHPQDPTAGISPP